MKVKDVLDLAKKNNVQVVDLKFIDMPGLWQHFTISTNEFGEDLFNEGIGFDGSSIRGFQAINESDMLLFPDPASAFIDPFSAVSTLSLTCNIKDPITGQSYTRDPRYIAQKAEKYLKSSGIADISYWGPELEFYIFDDVRFEQSYNKGMYMVDSKEGFWNSGKDENPNLGNKIRYKEGYFPVPPMDSLQDIRNEMLLTLQKVGINIEVHHHEVATAGQCEIDMKFDTLTTMADKVMKYKYVVKNVARKHNKVVTFMPKPIFMDNGSGMHVHQSLWKNSKNLFFKLGGYGDVSEMALHYIGGLLKHAPALCAFIAPTTNSYRRLVPGYEAPINLVYSQRNRSACVRIPMYSKSEKSKRIEFRTPDPSSNSYLAFAAMLMAGLDGVQNKIEPPKPIDKDLYELEPEEAEKIKHLPGSLDVVLDALEKDHDFMLKGDVFTKDLIETWISYKRAKEVDAIRLRPHPYEFALYFDI
ncbi:MAG: type I glutamate--ammonia ligase [Nitrospirae bacterium RBG_19FT_COMBO_42_15]|nr:MAG: type I glutamate--ammonia ligase [Nitrospirae bacterium RBG_19FT_COMBO_42_15]